MADAPHAMKAPLVIIQHTAAGDTVETWQPPASGWTQIGETKRFANSSDAHNAAAPEVVRHNGALAVMLTPPGWLSPFAKAKRR